MDHLVVGGDVALVEESRRIRSTAVEQRILARNCVLDAQATIEESRVARAAAELSRTRAVHAGRPGAPAL